VYKPSSEQHEKKSHQHDLFHMSHDLGTVTIFRLLGLGFGLGKGLRLGLGLGLSLKYKRIQNYKSLKIVTLPKM
jgi:hypothetical protein